MASPQPAVAPVKQLALVRGAVRRSRTDPPDPPAAVLPVASVAVDLPLAHLDRPFDYLVPESMSATAVPGARVRVRVAGRELAGFVLERRPGSDFSGRLEKLRRVVSAEPVLAADVARLARKVADRYAGTLSDVLRLAVPPRVAKVEAELSAVPAPRCAPTPPPPTTAGPWPAYSGGARFLRALADGSSPRAVWSALPGEDWAGALSLAVQASLSAGRGALVLVPDGRDLDRVDAALRVRLGEGSFVALSAELGPTERYRRWLRVRRGQVRAVVGTRAAMFAPVHDLGLLTVWDDGDDLHAEPRAPYPHVREVLALRAHDLDAALLVAGHARTPEAEHLVRSGWAGSVAAPRHVVRAAAPRVLAAGSAAELARDEGAARARLPSLAWMAAKEALERGPVLVQVPRSGYLPVLACRTCQAPASCGVCAGPLGMASGAAVPACRWCGRPAATWRCRACSDDRFRAQVVGSRRTAEELGRAFPAVPVRICAGDAVVASVGPRPALVVATPGAEPVAEDGYAAALLLDGWAMLNRPDLRAGEETLRRWLAAAALVRPAGAGGVVVVLADSAQPAVQALVRWDPAGFAARELAERTELRFPPTARLAALTGPAAALAELLEATKLPLSAEVLGPVPDERGEAFRTIVRVPRGEGGALSAALRAGQGVRSAHKAAAPVRVQIDPIRLG